MPTALRPGPFRLLFHAGDRDEPAHVHVDREERIATFWLDPVHWREAAGLSVTRSR